MFYIKIELFILSCYNFLEFIGEAVRTNCKKCTEKQKVILARVIDWYKKNQPDQWNVFVEKRVKV